MNELTIARLRWHLPPDVWQELDRVAAELGATRDEVLTLAMTYHDIEYSGGKPDEIRRVAY